jgi:hypothetical protein
LEEISMKNLVRVSKSKEAGLPFATQTYFKWKHLGKYPELFIKFGGALFIDLDAHGKLMEAGRLKAEHEKEPRRMNHD